MEAYSVTLDALCVVFFGGLCRFYFPLALCRMDCPFLRCSGEPGVVFLFWGAVRDGRLAFACGV